MEIPTEGIHGAWHDTRRANELPGDKETVICFTHFFGDEEFNEEDVKDFQQHYNKAQQP